MTIYKLPEMTVTALPDCPIAVALGNFDGVHRGHRRLLDTVKEVAAGIPGCVSAVWTFTVLVKEAGIPCLTTPEEKLRAIADAGVEYAVLEEFSAVRDLTPQAFASGYLADRLRCAAAVCGFNFRFGKGGAGDADTLTACLGERGISVTVVQPVLVGGEPVSSTRIRAAVLNGDTEAAAELLGRPFSLCLPVVRGHQLGRTIGVPTINQNFPKGHIMPKHGIYACVCTVGNRSFPAIANVGTRPTVSDAESVNCETHILGYEGSLYGESVRVAFYRRLRDEKKFPDVASLRAQILQDAEEARAFFSACPYAVPDCPRKED